MNESNPNTLNLDQQLQQAQRKGLSVYLLTGIPTSLILIGFFVWLLLIKATIFVISPKEALATASVNVQSGIAWVSGQRVYTVGDNAIVELGAERFESESVTLSSTSPDTIEVVLKPSPAIITADVSHINGETSWLIDGKLVHVGMDFEHSIMPGSYQLVFDNPYYEHWSESLILERGEIKALTVLPEAVGGTVGIKTEPSNANVYVNDILKGQSPFTFDAIGGEYDIRIESDGFETSAERLRVTRDNPNLLRNYRLSAKKGELSVDLTPKGGNLLVNGELVQSSLLKLDANKAHQLRYSKPGYYPIQKQITVDLRRPGSVSLSLKKVVADVKFTASLQADLFIDGQLIGPTPQTINLQALPKTAEFKRSGYRTVKQTFTSDPDAVKTLHATMLTEFEARRADGLPLFSNGLGIQMKRFRADAFVMGSAANESGRMRNEHQVPVDFSKSFWVSTHEVTEQQYASFDVTSPKTNKPITKVTWVQVAKFCNWLSANEGLRPFYQLSGDRLLGYDVNSKGYRLPTEAEWEWLAKKANRSTTTQYVWGDRETIPRKTANFADQAAATVGKFTLADYNDGFAAVAPVGSFKADRAGLFDLAGNVQEWVNDYYTNALPNLSDTQMDYMGPARGQQFVVKGASFKSGKLKDLRASKRTIGEGPRDDLGFRIARYH